jgi:hypothetical protein
MLMMMMRRRRRRRRRMMMMMRQGNQQINNQQQLWEIPPMMGCRILSWKVCCMGMMKVLISTHSLRFPNQHSTTNLLGTSRKKTMKKDGSASIATIIARAKTIQQS